MKVIRGNKTWMQIVNDAIQPNWPPTRTEFHQSVSRNYLWKIWLKIVQDLIFMFTRYFLIHLIQSSTYCCPLSVCIINWKTFGWMPSHNVNVTLTKSIIIIAISVFMLSQTLQNWISSVKVIIANLFHFT